MVTAAAVRYEVARLTSPISSVREFQPRYEAVVPDLPVAAVSDLVSRKAPWSEMIDLIDARRHTDSSSTSATMCTR